MIYFIQAGIGSGPIKIGFAETRAGCGRRVGLLQVGNAERLHLVAVVGGGMDRERELHQHFRSGHIRGEWFEWDTPGLQDLISDALHEEVLIEGGARYCEQCRVNIVRPPRRKPCSAECERQKKIATARAWKRAPRVPVVEDDMALLEKALLQAISDDHRDF